MKKNCRVIITHNLSNGLVNGLSGTVTDLQDDYIELQIDADEHLQHGLEGKTFRVHKYSFLVRDTDGNVTGSRIQYPIKLGYATTIHKAQGRTIPELIIDCETFWKPGQMGIAVGRSVSKDGLQVLNYNSYAAQLPHLQIVDDFYRSPGIQVNYDNQRCYHQNEIQSSGTVRNHAFQFQVPPLVPLQKLHINDENCKNLEPRNFPYDMEHFIDEQMFKGITPMQQECNELIKNHQESDSFIRFIHEVYHHIRNLFDTFQIPTKKSKCNWCVLCAKIQDYLTSSHYNEKCKKAFRKQTLLLHMKAVCSKIYMDILGKFAHDAVSSIISDNSSSTQISQEQGDLTLPEQNTLVTLLEQLFTKLLQNYMNPCFDE